MKRIKEILENEEEYHITINGVGHGCYIGSYYSILYNIAKNINVDGYVVEIGTDQGESAIALSYGLRHGQINKKVITVDIGITQEARGDKLSESLRRAWVNEKMVCHDMMDDIITVGCSSKEFSKFFSSPISLLFVDGEHTQEGVIFDIEYYGSLLTSGGVIVIDDYNSHLSGIIDSFFEF